MELTKKDIVIGHTYRGKHPRKHVFTGDYDDRTVLWVGAESVQYDSNAVGRGRHYPKVPMERFLKWADSDIGAAEIIRNTFTGLQVIPASKEA